MISLYIKFLGCIFLSCAVITPVIIFNPSSWKLPQVVKSKGELKSLNEDNWTDMLHEESMVAFFSPCCPACQQLEPLWKEFAEWSKDLGIKVGNIDVTTSPSLSVRFMITEVPKIFHVKDGVFRQYRGARDKKSFISFVEEKKWKSIDPVPRWKSPQSYLMTAVAFVFKLPMFLKSMYNTLMEDVIPAVGCY